MYENIDEALIVTRCKDCMYIEEDEFGDWHCKKNGAYWNLNDFCSDGKKKTMSDLAYQI